MATLAAASTVGGASTVILHLLPAVPLRAKTAEHAKLVPRLTPTSVTASMVTKETIVKRNHPTRAIMTRVKMKAFVPKARLGIPSRANATKTGKIPRAQRQ